jgi:hypothetical protein
LLLKAELEFTVTFKAELEFSSALEPSWNHTLLKHLAPFFSVFPQRRMSHEFA